MATKSIFHLIMTQAIILVWLFSFRLYMTKVEMSRATSLPYLMKKDPFKKPNQFVLNLYFNSFSSALALVILFFRLSL